MTAIALRHVVDLVIFEVRKAYVGSALGLAWAIVEPLAFLGTYFLLFAVILKVPYEGPGGSAGYLLFLFSGLAPWLFFNNCVARGTTILRAHAPLVKQINFPIDVLPLIVVAHIAVEFAINLTLLVLLAAAIGLVSWTALILVPAVLMLTVFCVAVAHILSCYGIILPDISRVITTLLRIGLFVTPVLYVPSAMPSAVKIIAVINPVSYLIVPFRYAFLPGEDVFVFGLWQDLAIGAAVVVVSVVAALAHRRFVRAMVVDFL